MQPIIKPSNEPCEKYDSTAQQLAESETARLAGTQSYTLEQFRNNMLQAIKRGASKNE